MIENLQFSQSIVSGVIPVGKDGGNKFTDLTKIYDMKQDGVYQITLSRFVPKRIDPKGGAKSRYPWREITPEEWARFCGVRQDAEHKPTNATQVPAAPPKTKVTSATDSNNEWIKITSNTIRIGIGDIPDGALDEKPVEKAAPTKTGEAKSSPPVKPEAKK